MIDAGRVTGSPNLLLAALPAGAAAQVAANAQAVMLVRGQVLHESNRPAAAAFFLESGTASVVKRAGRIAPTEICLIGRESFVGGALVLGDGVSPYQTFVQTECASAIAIEAGPFGKLVEAVPDLRALLLRAMQARLVQLGEGLVSAAWQRLPARLARWLLMYRDRLDSNRLEITHDFIAAMIGVQRTGITAALHDLEGQGLVQAGRGYVLVRDLAGLERVADGSYGLTESEQRRLLAGVA